MKGIAWYRVCISRLRFGSINALESSIADLRSARFPIAGLLIFGLSNRWFWFIGCRLESSIGNLGWSRQVFARILGPVVRKSGRMSSITIGRKFRLIAGQFRTMGNTVTLLNRLNCDRCISCCNDRCQGNSIFFSRFFNRSISFNRLMIGWSRGWAAKVDKRLGCGRVIPWWLRGNCWSIGRKWLICFLNWGKWNAIIFCRCNRFIGRHNRSSRQTIFLCRTYRYTIFLSWLIVVFRSIIIGR